MVTAESDELGFQEKGGGRRAFAKLCEGCGHLHEGDGVVHGRDGDITTINDLSPIRVGVDIRRGVEAPE